MMQMESYEGRDGVDVLENNQISSAGALNKGTCSNDQGNRLLQNSNDETSGGTLSCQRNQTCGSEQVDDNAITDLSVSPCALRCSYTRDEQHSECNVQTFGGHVGQFGGEEHLKCNLQTFSDRAEQLGGEQDLRTSDTRVELLGGEENLQVFVDHIEQLGSEEHLQTSGDNVGQLPFAKTSSLWQKIESMEVFRRFQTTPHFLPLKRHIKEQREGIAIGKMVTFASLIEKMRNSKFHDPSSSFESRLKVLVDLESHGFDVQLLRSHLLGMIRKKKMQEEFDTRVSLLEQKILKQKQTNKRFYSQICEIDRNVLELDKHIALLHKRRVSVEKPMENSLSVSSILEKEKQVIKEKCFMVKQDFENVVVKPFPDQCENLPVQPKCGSSLIIDLSSDGDEHIEKKTISENAVISSPNFPLHEAQTTKKCTGKPTLKNYAGKGRLDQNDKLVVEEFLKRADQDSMIVWEIEDNHITRADVLNLLTVEHVLRDPVISCFNNLLKHRVQGRNMVLLKCQYISPWVHVNISRTEYDKVESCLVKLTAETLAESQLVFVPLCSDGHWHLLVINLSEKSFNAYDSLPNRKHKIYATKIILLEKAWFF